MLSQKLPTNQGLVSCLGKPAFLIQKGKQSQGFLEEHIQEWPIILILHRCCVNALIVILHLEGNRMCISPAQNWPVYHEAALACAFVSGNTEHMWETGCVFCEQ